MDLFAILEIVGGGIFPLCECTGSLISLCTILAGRLNFHEVKDHVLGGAVAVRTFRARIIPPATRPTRVQSGPIPRTHAPPARAA